jgi:hypothetical protein
MGAMRSAYINLVGKLEGKRQPARSKCRWEENVKTDLKQRRFGNCIYVAQNRGQMWQ